MRLIVSGSSFVAPVPSGGSRGDNAWGPFGPFTDSPEMIGHRRADDNDEPWPAGPEGPNAVEPGSAVPRAAAVVSMIAGAAS